MPETVFDNLLEFYDMATLESMGDKERFSLLEELLQKSPETSVWNAICELFTTWTEGQEKEAALDYADTNLAHWDNSLRHIDSSWMPLYYDDEVSSLGKLIRSIEISDRSEVGTTELIQIAQSPYLQNLKRLSILRCEIYSEGFMTLANSPYMQNLTHLEIYKTDILDEELTLLLLSPYLISLTSLELERLGLKDKDVAAIAESSLLKNLTHLNLSQNYIEAEGAKIIAQAQNLLGLKYLNLKSNFIRDIGAYELTKAPFFPTLEELNISENMLTQEAINNIALITSNQAGKTNIILF